MQLTPRGSLVHHTESSSAGPGVDEFNGRRGGDQRRGSHSKVHHTDGDRGCDRAIHVAMFPFLAFGHISPFAQLARKLVAGGDGAVQVTFLSAAANVPRVDAMLGLGNAAATGSVAVVPLQLPHVASFGSETFLKADTATELLLGLEATSRPFLVVLNFPKGTDAEAQLKKCTPLGFEERVKGRGVVHMGWVQQQHILRHRSVGCFVNHAGFSSVVEGLVAGPGAMI